MRHALRRAGLARKNNGGPNPALRNMGESKVNIASENTPS